MNVTTQSTVHSVLIAVLVLSVAGSCPALQKEVSLVTAQAPSKADDPNCRVHTSRPSRSWPRRTP